MAYQETTRTSYGSKVKGSFQGILWGLILIIAGTIVLWWNEGRAVKSSNALKDFQKNYVEMADINSIDVDFEGKAVHATGVATTADTLRDPAFGIAVNAFRLTRDVEYYQWQEQSSSESKDKLGGSTETTTTYTYEPEWCSEPVNSAEFKDPDYKGKNFVWRVVEDADQHASNATFGAYKLTDGIIGAISGAEPVSPSLTEAQMKQLLAKVTDSTVVVTVRGNQVYIGADPDVPHIGDVRITFNQVTSPKTISLLQKVVNGTFESYIAKNGQSFSKVEMGTVSAENMIAHQKSANKMMLWLLRILGIILVIGGFKGLLGFLSTIFAVVPFIQKIIGTGVGLVATVVGLIWSLVVIALAWVSHRPVLGISLLVLAVALVAWLIIRGRKKKINDVAALLAIVLMIGLAGCTDKATNNGGGDGTAVAASVAKGPVQTIKVTYYQGEGEPYSTFYYFNEKGEMTGEEEEYYGDYEGEGSSLIEALCEKDAEGRYTKEVYGSDGEPELILIYEYDDRGNVLMSQSRQGDGTVMNTSRNTYNADGRIIRNVNVNNYGESANYYEYDDKGRQVKSDFSSNGTPLNSCENTYDDNGNLIYQKTHIFQSNQVNEYYTFYDDNDEMTGSRNYVTDEKGRRLQHSDSTYVDSKGLRHERTYYNYDETPRTNEGVFNKQGQLTHFEYFKGTAANPEYVVDFNYDKDGTTLCDVTWKEMSLGNVKNTYKRKYTPRYDTFGNWTRRTNGIGYLLDGEYTKFENLDDNLSQTVRDISYYGDDQGQNYGFEGKAGKAAIQLLCTEDEGVLFGELTIDGNAWRTVGTRDKEDNLFFVALEEEGDIPWSLSIPAGEGKRNATLFSADNEAISVTLNPTRKGTFTYDFEGDSDEIVGLYRYNFLSGTTSGELDTYLTGDNWDNIKFEIENVWNAEFPKVAAEEYVDYFGDRTEFYEYKWTEDSDAHLEYTIRFFDGFAVITVTGGNPNDFYPIGTTIAGIYAKLPAVG